MGHRTFMYSASHPEGRIFDSDDLPALGPEWVDHPDNVAPEATVLDLTAPDDELARWSKDALEEAARASLGLELDRRKSVPNMIADIRAAQE